MKDESLPIVPFRRDEVEALGHRAAFVDCSGVAGCAIKEPGDLFLTLSGVENFVAWGILYVQSQLLLEGVSSYERTSSSLVGTCFSSVIFIDPVSLSYTNLSTSPFSESTIAPPTLGHLSR
jgi:hypothetical protein